MWCSSAAGSSSLTVSPLRLYRNKDASASVSLFTLFTAQMKLKIESQSQCRFRTTCLSPFLSLPLSVRQGRNKVVSTQQGGLRTPEDASQ